MLEINELKTIIAGQIDLYSDEIADDARLKDDLGLTSFDMMMIMCCLEKEAGKSIDIESLSNVITVNDFYKKLNAEG